MALQRGHAEQKGNAVRTCQSLPNWAAHSRSVLSVDLRFDSSVGRGDLNTEIGVGRVIRGTYCPAT